MRALVNGPHALQSADDVTIHLLKLVDNATREDQGGRFMNWDGAVNPW
jgi:hypothetical protein